MTVAIAILMKDPADAKTRLTPTVGNDAREALALLLFKNTLGFFQRFHKDRPLAVISPSNRIADIAFAHGAEAVVDDARGDINAAAARAREWAQRINATSLLIVHADIPTLETTELSELIKAGNSNAVALAESRDGGTNALMVSPPDAIPFRFGRNSASAHEAAACELGRTAIRLRLPHLSRDIDTPGDLVSCLLNGELPDGTFTAIALRGLPEIREGDDLAALITEALVSVGAELKAHDIVVVAQKVVSKSEGRMVPLASYNPSPEAQRVADDIGKDARKVEAILQESSDILRARRQEPDGLLITRHRHGWICANAGIDESNLGDGNEGMLLLLPEDPDASARTIRAGIEKSYGGPIGVVVIDTFGRPWRHGLVNVAIGVAGVPAVVDWTTRTDAYGRGLKATLPAFADELAAAAGLLMQKDAGLPVVIIRGLSWADSQASSARDILRPIPQELFL